MKDQHLAHYGIKGQRMGVRRFQSYETAPTRSGMVGQEVGEAAKQRSRLGLRERLKANKYSYKDSDKYKNASAKDKKKMDDNYDYNINYYGKKKANRMQYRAMERGEHINDLRNEAYRKKVASMNRKKFGKKVLKKNFKGRWSCCCSGNTDNIISYCRR